jgi:glucose/arabinose dehydrogenase
MHTSMQLAGVRNTVGWAFHPDNGQMYFSDNGRDEMGDNLPDCELNRVTQPGQFFGFPYCHSLGTGSPYKRDTGVNIPLTDWEQNNGSKVMDCDSECASAGGRT